MKVSIVLVTYNHEKYIEKAVESILMQRDCPDFEIIVADDHSNDNTTLLVQELLKDDPRARISVNPVNMGITRNYQQAFERCRGAYIFILEGDDYWIDPLKVKKQVEFMDQHPFCGMCGHPYYLQKEELGVFTPPQLVKEDRYSFFDCRDIILDPSVINNFSVSCYRKSVLDKIAPETYKVISYDWMINISIADFGQVARINEAMSVYRICSSGAWSGHTPESQLKGMIDIIPEYDRILKYRYTEYFQVKRQRLQEQLNTRLHPPVQQQKNLLRRYLGSFVRRINR